VLLKFIFKYIETLDTFNKNKNLGACLILQEHKF